MLSGARIYTKDNQPLLPDTVVVFIFPDEKIGGWYYFREENRKFYGDHIEFSGTEKFNEKIEKEVLEQIITQINNSIKKLDEEDLKKN